MVPSGVHDNAPPASDRKTLRSRAREMRQTERDSDAPLSSPDGGGVEAEAAGQQEQRRRRRRQQRRSRMNNDQADVVLDNQTRIKRRVKNLLIKMRVGQNLLDAYLGEGWKGQSREKIRQERELQRAKARILHSKLAIREALHNLDDLGLEGSLENAFDAEGRIYHEEIFCAKCKSEEALLDNDIILCDGACNRGFHQYCLDPPLATINIPPGDEGWLCPVCKCKMECVEAINSYLNTNFEVENSWEEFVGSHGSSIGKKRGREHLDGENQERDFPDINELNIEDDKLDLDSEASCSDSEDGDVRTDQIEIPVEDVELAATPEIAKRCEGRGLNTSFAKKQRVVETLDDYSSPTTLPSDWKEAVETITLGSSVPVIAICGSKNVGKSTFARFLVNSLLNRYKEVAYLDTDVGQPEFTAPGCLSLHVLDNPVVGLPAMHLRSPERCFFYGDVTPKSNPLMYGEHVTGLVNYFREKYSVNSTSTIPLVINTHGWVKGIGYDVVVNILNSTSPTHVVQVLANSKKKNLPRNKFWNEMSVAETIYVESAVEKLPMHHRSARSAHHLRAAQFLAYFQQCFGENSAHFPYREARLFAQTAMSLVKDTPYEVPFTALKIKHLHSEVPPSESLRCVNATIVGLGVTSTDKDTRDNDDLSRSSVPLCLGLGIVKAVDMRKGVFYISTPVPQEQLQHVDILLQGRVEIPVPLLMARGFMCPYLKKTSQIVEGVGAGAMKSTMKPSAKKVQ